MACRLFPTGLEVEKEAFGRPSPRFPHEYRDIDVGSDISVGYKVDVSRGENVGRVSSELFLRPDDERYLSLDDLFASVKGRAERSRTRTVESAAIQIEAHRDNPERLGLVLPGADELIAPTHWSFGQLSSIVGAPAVYLRQLPAPLAGINLQCGLTNHRAEQIKRSRPKMDAWNSAP